MDLDFSQINNTEADALGMAYSLALKTLMDQMVDPNLDASERRWAAEAILKHDETYVLEKETNVKRQDNTDD